MNKQMEQLLIVLALGATAFVLWRAYRNGASLGALGNMTGASAPTLSLASFKAQLAPKADDLINSIYGNTPAIVYNNGAQYVNAPSGLVDVATLPPI